MGHGTRPLEVGLARQLLLAEVEPAQSGIRVVELAAPSSPLAERGLAMMVRQLLGGSGNESTVDGRSSRVSLLRWLRQSG